MKILIFGGTGMLGTAISTVLAERGIEYKALTRAECDVRSEDSIKASIELYEPSHVINAMAWTQVEDAEVHAEEAHHINAVVPEYIAKACTALGIEMLHYSTDFVFDGHIVSPYTEESVPNPLSVYGSTKLAGEKAVLLHAPKSYIIRTAWLFGHGRKNFITTVIQCLRDNGSMRVVANQVGSPTSTYSLSLATMAFLEKTMPYGLYHVVNAGETSWYGLASYASECLEYFTKERYEVIPIRSEEFPQKAVRPVYSVLNTSYFTQHAGVHMPHWRSAVREYISVISHGNTL